VHRDEVMRSHTKKRHGRNTACGRHWHPAGSHDLLPPVRRDSQIAHTEKACSPATLVGREPHCAAMYLARRRGVTNGSLRCVPGVAGCIYTPGGASCDWIRMSSGCWAALKDLRTPSNRGLQQNPESAATASDSPGRTTAWPAEAFYRPAPPVQPTDPAPRHEETPSRRRTRLSGQDRGLRERAPWRRLRPFPANGLKGLDRGSAATWHRAQAGWQSWYRARIWRAAPPELSLPTRSARKPPSK